MRVYPILSAPGKAIFIVADGTTREVPWIETRSLPADNVQAEIEKAAHYNDQVIGTYNYDVPTLVKLQSTQIAVAALAVSLLGENPTVTDEEIIRYALTDIRDIFPKR